MSKNEIASPIQLAARLTDLLYKGTYISSDSAQALFDVLADALAKRPDIVISVAAELHDHDEQLKVWYNGIMNRLSQLEQDIERNHNND